MTVELTTLANGVRVVSEHMPHLETVSLGVVGRRRRASRDRTARTASRISSSTWRSRARAGAAPQQIAEEIEEVGGELNAATRLETTAYFARVLKGDEAWRSTSSPTSCRTPPIGRGRARSASAR